MFLEITSLKVLWFSPIFQLKLSIANYLNLYEELRKKKEKKLEYFIEIAGINSIRSIEEKKERKKVSWRQMG